jgi:hypothetical protein
MCQTIDLFRYASRVRANDFGRQWNEKGCFEWRIGELATEVIGAKRAE